MKSRIPLLLFSLFGLGASLTSTYVHYNLLIDRSFSSFCDVNATVSCTQAYLSSYGSFLGVPVAVGGVFFFALVLAIAALSGRKTPQAGESAPGYIFALSTVALAFVLYLGYASFFVLHTVCILCVTTYLSVIAVFLISGAATSFPMATLAEAGRPGCSNAGLESGGAGDRRAVRRRRCERHRRLSEGAGRGPGRGAARPRNSRR